MKKKARSYNFRSSKTGRFVKKAYARKHPATTERELRRFCPA